jgi:ECF transporter S component (folate family)
MSKTRRLTTDAVLMALYVILTAFVSIRAGNLHISLASLPIVVCALLYGPGDACAVAALGEFMNQMLSYGFTVTTPLWLIPPMIRALTIGIAASAAAKQGKRLERSVLWFYVLCAAAAVLTTLSNTGVIWVDSLLLGYFSEAYVFGDFTVRLVTGLVTSAVVATAAMPVTIALRRSGFGPKTIRPQIQSN